MYYEVYVIGLMFNKALSRLRRISFSCEQENHTDGD